MSVIRGVIDGARDAFPAAAGSGVTAAGGAVLGAPGWLIGLGQAVVVVVFVLRGIDRRNSKLNDAVSKLHGQVQTLQGRLNGLACQRSVADCEEEG